MAANLALARRDETGVTSEQLELVKKTVAKDATDAELKLFLYDCQRRGVHPLDRLLHFTKRGGKYTPIVSIDLMRSRAAETCEYAGSEDAIFSGVARSDDFSATMTVYRLVQGQRCAFTATARWSEYCPSAGQDMMWKKMPHTMLAKVAESLALRKGFPQQLGGLYASEEMDQAQIHEAEFVEKPEPKPQPSPVQSEIIELWRTLESKGDPSFAGKDAKLAHLKETAKARKWDVEVTGLRDVPEAYLQAYKSSLADKLADLTSSF